MLSAPMPLPTQSRSGGPGRAENAVCPPAMVDRYTLWLAVGCTNSKQARNRCTPRDKINLLLKKSSRCPSTVTGKGRPRACELHYRTGGRTWPPLGGSRWEAVIPSVDIEGVGTHFPLLGLLLPRGRFSAGVSQPGCAARILRPARGHSSFVLLPATPVVASDGHPLNSRSITVMIMARGLTCQVTVLNETGYSTSRVL